MNSMIVMFSMLALFVVGWVLRTNSEDRKKLERELERELEQEAADDSRQ